MAKAKLQSLIPKRLSGRRLILAGSLAVLLAVYLLLALQHIGDPFIRISEDTNGTNGVGAWNLMRLGVLDLKFGLSASWLTSASEGFGHFYTNHPVGFLMPTVLLYKLFGVSEITTRLGPLLLTLLAVAFLYLALEKIFQSYAASFLVVFILVILPGFVYYGKHLDMQAPSLALMLISFSLFVFHYLEKKRVYLYLFLASVLVGGFIDWFYYFLPAAIWLFVLLSRPGRSVAEREKYLFWMPALLGGALIINLFQIYLLNGARGWAGLKWAFFNRAAGVPLSAWLARLNWIGQLNIGLPFMVSGGLGLAWFVYRWRTYQRRQLLLPLLLAPLLIMLLFRQWSTHPFGLIFFLPAAAVFSGLLFYELTKKSPVGGLVLTAVGLVAGLHFSLAGLDRFYNSNYILGQRDVAVLKELGRQTNSRQVCEGANNLGLNYSGIVNWYLQGKTASPPGCYAAADTIGLIFNPGLGQFYQEKAAVFAEKGFQLVGCAEIWCLMTKNKE